MATMPAVKTYGLPEGGDQLLYDRYAFSHPLDRRLVGCAPRPQLFKAIAEELLPKHFEWHDWTNNIVEACCFNEWVGFAGCAGSAKTFNVAGFAATWWLCSPEESSVIFCSTTAKALRRRGWSEIQKVFYNLGDRQYGNFVDSRMVWQSNQGDDKHAIIGIAVREGSVTERADNIKGHHTRRQMVVIDEATAVPKAIFEACFNLSSACEEFLLVVIGNPRSRLDEMGKFCEPKDGWQSVTVETDEWETKPQQNGKFGIVVRFDAEKSPNIVQGRTVSRHLPTKAKVESRRALSGSENSPSYWSNERGFWPPHGLTKTVFSEVGIINAKGFEKHLFTGRNFKIIGAFDPAFGGGDRPALRFAKMGEISNGNIGIEVLPPTILSIDASSKNPVHYQLAEQLQRQCESFNYNGTDYSCDPENLGIDATGEGGGLCDIVQRIWSSKVIRIEFGGGASEDSCSPEDIRPAKEVYWNKRAEMYFRSRDAMNHEQLRGLDQATARELCTIEFDDSRARIVMMSKKDYKEQFGESPDLSDSFVMLIEVARQRGFRIQPIGQTVMAKEEFYNYAEEVNSVYVESDENGYQPEELEFVE